MFTPLITDRDDAVDSLGKSFPAPECVNSSLKQPSYVPSVDTNFSSLYKGVTGGAVFGAHREESREIETQIAVSRFLTHSVIRSLTDGGCYV